MSGCYVEYLPRHSTRRASRATAPTTILSKPWPWETELESDAEVADEELELIRLPAEVAAVEAALPVSLVEELETED